jgi:F-type H+-transporting ATPase subunit b
MATSAQTGVPGGEKPPFPPFNADTFASQLVWLAIFFVALYMLMWKVVIPRIGGIVEARREQIEGDLAEAGRFKDRSDAALAAYEKSLNDARARAQALAGETRDKLNAEAEDARRKLEAELNARLADADKTIAATKAAAMANVRGIATETAGTIVQRLIGTVPSGKALEDAVTNVLKG